MYNVSGAGKTRTVLEGLCSVFGIYMTMGIPGNHGSADLSSAMEHMQQKLMNLRAVPPGVDAHDEALYNHDAVTRHLLAMLLSRLLALSAYLKSSPVGSSKAFLFFQLFPFVDDRDILLELWHILSPVSGDDLRSWIAETWRDVKGCLGREELPIFVDEAQLGLNSMVDRFLSASDEAETRPFLAALCRTYGSPDSFTRVFLTGTGLSLTQAQQALGSFTAKATAQMDVFVSFPSLIEESDFKGLWDVYFPGADYGQAYKWLKGRPRFLATYIEKLLVTWDRIAVLEELVDSLTAPVDLMGLGSIGSQLERLVQGHRPAFVAGTNFLDVVARIVTFYLFTGSPAPLRNHEEFQLIDIGFARLRRRLELSQAFVEEPLAIVAASRWLQSGGRGGLLAQIERSMLNVGVGDSSLGFLWEYACAAAFDTVLDGRTPLSETLLRDLESKPVWADEAASIAPCFWRDGHIVAEDRDPNVVLAGRSSAEGDFVKWLEDPQGRRVWFPEEIAGPDLGFILRTSRTGTLIPVICQV
ncbi:hypothetical protein HK097_010699 [Rhizophlyctis rosea]|uniref:Uncharacterized protein n=1 Tax=Rhizophlyctis rosea TaxID=64517 RepID=A0AAD5S9Z2_9FUNG|nr:hypothetical protein HK097_010699 [Rhizophlyctis rosea]